MAHWYLDDNGLLALWGKIKDRSLPIKEITKAEYAALDEDKKNSETVYLIIDDSASSSSGGPCKADECEFDPGDTEMKADNVQNAIYELFTSVSEGKALLASAITDMGVETAADATWEQMAENILAIKTKYEPTYKAGVDWWESTLPESRTWFKAVYGYGRFMVTSVDSSNKIATSRDGVVWSLGTLPSSDQWRSAAYGKNKFVIIAGNYGYSSNKVLYSENSVDWKEASIPVTAAWYSVVYGGGMFVAIANGSDNAAYSYDGINWNASKLPASLRWYDVVYGDGTFVAFVTNAGAIRTAYSKDGINWKESNFLTSADWRGMAYVKNRFVAVARGKAEVAFSEDGITWTEQKVLPANAWIYLICGKDDMLIALASNDDTFAYSYDGGFSWEFSTLPFSAAWNNGVYGNGGFIAVPSDKNNDRIAYSMDTDFAQPQSQSKSMINRSETADTPTATIGQLLEYL